MDFMLPNETIDEYIQRVKAAALREAAAATNLVSQVIGPREPHLGSHSPAQSHTGMMSPAHSQTGMMSPAYTHAVQMSPGAPGHAPAARVQLPTPAITNLKASAPMFEEEKFPTVVKVYMGPTSQVNIYVPKK